VPSNPFLSAATGRIVFADNYRDGFLLYGVGSGSEPLKKNFFTFSFK